MKTVFVGCVEMSHRSLEKLIKLGVNIDMVFTKSSSKYNADYADLTALCRRYGLRYACIKNINDRDNVKQIKAIAPDVMFCIGWSQIIGSEILSIPRIGVIGFHPALLPKNRGRHPIIWTLALGLSETGSTFFLMDEGADSGDIISQRIITVAPNDDAASLYEKIADTAMLQIEEIVIALRNNALLSITQDHGRASYWRKRGLEDGRIDWRMSAVAIDRLVRALARPYIGAHVVVGDKEIKVWKTKVVQCNEKNIEPGKVLDIDGRSVIIKCGEDAIELIEHELPVFPEKGSYLS